MIQATSLKFLKDLAKNNNREWFEKNRSKYEDTKADFIALTDAVIKQLAKKDNTIADQVGKDCIYRINRDVRFSKNKAPYKNNLAASIIMGGKKAEHAGYYIQIQPGKCFIGGGKYMTDPPMLKKIRQEIDYSWEEFQKIIKNKKFVSVYGDLDRSEGMQLSREPKGYEKDNPAIDYIKFKSWVAITDISDADITGKDAVKKIVAALEALHPLIVFLNRAIAE